MCTIYLAENGVRMLIGYADSVRESVHFCDRYLALGSSRTFVIRKQNGRELVYRDYVE